MSRLVDLAALTPATATVAVACVLLAILAKAAYFPSLDPREPPLVCSTVPFIGHILGMVQHQSDYFTRLVCVPPPPLTYPPEPDTPPPASAAASPYAPSPCSTARCT